MAAAELAVPAVDAAAGETDARRPVGDDAAAPGGGGFAAIFQTLTKYLMIYLLVQGVISMVVQPPTGVPAGGAALVASGPRPLGGVAPHTPPLIGVNFWDDGDLLDVRFVLSVDAEPSRERFRALLERHPDETSPEGVVWGVNGMAYEASDVNKFHAELTVPVSPHMLSNASLYMHITVARGGAPFEAGAPDVARLAYPLVRWAPPRKVRAKKSLLGSASELEPVAAAPDACQGNDLALACSADNAARAADDSLAIAAAADDDAPAPIAYWVPRMTVYLVADQSGFSSETVPAPLAPLYRLEHAGTRYGYVPPLRVDELWLMNSHLMPLNATLAELPLELWFSPLGLVWLVASVQMGESIAMQSAFGASASGGDDIKRLLMETNPWLLALTVTVSLVHMVFDFLAFKNDIAHWRGRKDMAGTSVNALLLGLALHVVILLYLFDNETSWTILFSSCIGLAIELWKASKAVRVRVARRWPFVALENKDAAYASSTKGYDDLAFRYMGRSLAPLVVGVALYSLVYKEHRSWYSWVLGSLVSGVYAFGFIALTPQLYVNYRLKSVAHMSWRALTYKTLGTFVDDLFAFVVTMPILHRIACFRDDLIFFAYLYQRWAYPVDPRRRNEYGQVSPAETERAGRLPAAGSADGRTEGSTATETAAIASRAKVD